MNGISFDNKELLKNFRCDSCHLFLDDKDIKDENYSFWLSDYANEINKSDTGTYSAKFWLRGVSHIEGECPESDRCEGCFEYSRIEELKEYEDNFYCNKCFKEKENNGNEASE